MADNSSGSGTGAPVSTTTDVLKAEYGHFWPNDPAPPATRTDYYRKAFANGQAALCLSGGGIRSASFALGVLQALSSKRLLTGFHYLSTVSGGGYIGSWLQRWIHEEEGNAVEVMNRLGDVVEPPEVTALRENSNFITPRIGLGSNDTWTAIAISGRNVSLNWLLFGPLLTLVALLPNLFQSSVQSMPDRAHDVQAVPIVLLALCALFAAMAGWFVVRQLPSYRASTDVAAGKADGWLMSRIVFPLVAWSVTGTLVLAAELIARIPPDSIPGSQTLFVVDGAALALVSLVASIAGVLASGFTLPPDPVAKKDEPNEFRRTFVTDILLWATSLGLGALAVLLFARLFHALIGGLPEALPATAVLTVLAPLWLMGTQLLVAIVFAGFREARGKTVRPDGDREWIARLSAVKIKPMLLWGVAGFSVLILNALLSYHLERVDMSLTGLVALVTGAGAVAGGKSEKSGNTSSKVKDVGSSIFKILPMQAIIALATFLFLIALFVILARVEGAIAIWLGKRIDLLNPPLWTDGEVLAHFAIVALLVGLLMFFRRRIQVNRFSLQGFYRNRLARAFLGGARGARTPDPFTGLDPADNVRLYQLAPQAGTAAVLYPIINITLNVTASEKLAWQERKAEPFIFSPRFSGSALLTPIDAKTDKPVPGLIDPHAPSDPPGAFIGSHIYGGNEPDLAMPGEGVSLATAMSLSGAAASPNMGYHTSPATAFLMTLFNVRLGAWLPNPAQADRLGPDIGRSGPNDSLRAILRELAGATDDRGRDIYLSDGGHFENLGIYEMVRRRCRYILISDAGADPDCSFEDLGNAVRKIKIDQDIDIAFEELRISSRNSPIDPQYAFALGTIEYPEARYQGDEPETDEQRRDRLGHLLYIKPSYFGDLPVDVRAYAAASETFPHESTGDQWYSESQFESYRRLGYFFTEALGKEGKAPPTTVAGFFAAIEAEHRQQQDKLQALEEEGIVARARQWLRL